MRRCGKRSFTRLRKCFRSEIDTAVRRLPGRRFCFCGGMVFLLGVLRKCGGLLWCFCGEHVVECVVNAVNYRTLFEGWGIGQGFEVYFSVWRLRDERLGIGRWGLRCFGVVEGERMHDAGGRAAVFGVASCGGIGCCSLAYML
jgi:hypothetical protein